MTKEKKEQEEIVIDEARLAYEKRKREIVIGVIVTIIGAIIAAFIILMALGVFSK